MSNRERVKGQRGELEVSRAFQAAGFDCDRTPNSGGLRLAGDLYGNVPAHIEVKRQEVLRLPLWTRQAAAEAPAGLLPVVAYRRSREPWTVCVPVAGLVELVNGRVGSGASSSAALVELDTLGVSYREHGAATFAVLPLGSLITLMVARRDRELEAGDASGAR